VSVSGRDLSVRVAHGRDLAPGLVADLAAAGTPVTRMEVVGPTLDDVFLDLTGRSLRESAETTDNTVTEGAAA
jgi:ABC-2 type transport system ATP-binding protein